MNKITKKYQSLLAASIILASSGAMAADSKHTQITTKQETPLQHIRIKGNQIQALANRLESLDYDVLENSVKGDQLEAIVSHEQLQLLLKAKALDVEVIDTGKPFQHSADAMPLDAIDLNSTKLAPPSGYKNLAQVMQELNAIAALNPNIAKVVDISAKYNQPPTIGGNHMYAIKISDNVNAQEDEPTVLVVSNHHVRELVTPVIALNAARNLVEQYGTNADVTQAVNDNEIWIAANWNPDGYLHVFEVDNMWRKNRRVMPNGIGVDLNRNYPVGWDTACSGSTTHSSQTYKGPSAGSEVETQTMMAWADDKRFTKVIDFHSSGQEVLWDYDPDCVTHPFDDHQKAVGQQFSVDAGYNRWRSATALGENFQWHLNKGANAYLVETHTSFQPSYASARAEAEQLWPALLNYFNLAIPVKGHINDNAGNPLEDVEVRVLNYNYPLADNNLSAANGRYQVHLPDGNYSLRFSKTGFTAVTKTVAVNGGTSQNLDVILSEGPVDNVNVLTKDQAMTALAGAQNEQTFYKLTVPDTATSLSFSMSGGTGDADLYVRKANKPSLTEYECRPYLGGNNESCDMNPSAGDWYVMLVGYSAYTGVSLTGSYSEGSSGNDSLNLNDLSAASGEQLHYSVDVPALRSQVTVTMSGGSGDGDLYVKFGSAPTTNSYDCRSWAYGNTESCNINRTGDKAYIMIHGYSAFSGANLSASSN